MVNKIQKLRGKTKLKCHQNICDDYDQMKYVRQSVNFQFEENSLSEGAQSIAFFNA